MCCFFLNMKPTPRDVPVYQDWSRCHSSRSSQTQSDPPFRDPRSDPFGWRLTETENGSKPNIASNSHHPGFLQFS